MIDQNELTVVVSHQHPRVSKGGAEVAAYALFKGLQARGKRAVFVAACPHSEQSKVLDLPEDEKLFFYHPGEYDHFYHIAPPDTVHQLISILGACKPSHVFFHHFYLVGINSIAAVARTFDAVLSLTFHEYLSICHHNGQMVTKPNRALCTTATPARCTACFPEHTSDQFRIRQDYLVESLDQIDFFISPSRFLAERITAWGLPASKISIIENGLLDLHEREPGGRRAAPRQQWTFGYFGQINPFKGVDVLLKSAELLAQAPGSSEIVIKLHGNFVGQTPEFIKRFEAALDGNKNLSYLGPYEHADVLKLMSECDYVIVPSVWWENSPVVIQEAYAARKPVITSDVGGLIEKVEANRTGFHFKIGDPRDLARTILAACDSVLHDKLVGNLPEPVSPESMAERYWLTVSPASSPPLLITQTD